MQDIDRAFFMYVSIVSFQFHPGVKVRLTPLQAFAECYSYMQEFKKRGDVWRGLDQRLEPGRA